MCTQVYTISICDVPWTEMAWPIPSPTFTNQWLFWISPHWRSPGEKTADLMIKQADPVIQHCFVSLAIFRAVTADNVNNQLEKLLWILANVGPKRASRALPEWVQADPAARLFVNQLLPHNEHRLSGAEEKAVVDPPEIKQSSPVS